jgi:hypothetical protein
MRIPRKTAVIVFTLGAALNAGTAKATGSVSDYLREGWEIKGTTTIPGPEVIL